MNKFYRLLLSGMAFRTGIKFTAKGLQAARKPWFSALGLGRLPAWAWPLAVVGIVIQVGSVAYMYYTATEGREGSPETNMDEVKGQWRG